MSQGINIIHHAGLTVKNAASAVLQFERLGFELTPASARIEPGQNGAAASGGGPWAAVFRRNYLEITAIPAVGGNTASLEDGLRIMCLGTDDLDAVRTRLRRDRIEVATADGPGVIRLKSTQLPAGSGEGLLRIVQHMTPDVVSSARHTQHPNGARMLTACIVCTEEPRHLAAKYSRYTGKPVHRSDDSYVIDLGYSRVRIVDPDYLGKMVPNSGAPELPSLVGFAVSTSGLDQARQALQNGRIEFTDRGERLVVSPAQACGTAVLFEPEETVV